MPKFLPGGFEMNIQLKKMISSILDLCDSINPHFRGGKTNLREICKVEFVRYTLYLSASDGVIKSEETEFLNTYFGYNMPVAEWVKFIKDNNIYSTEFEENVPLSLIAFVEVDNDIIQKGIGLDREGLGELLISTFEGIGRELIGSDRDINSQEIEDLNIYMKTLRNYLITNSDRDNIGDSSSIVANGEDYVDSDHEEVQFLGKSYILPDSYEICEYRNLMNSISEAYENVNDTLNSRIEKVKEDEIKYGNYGFCMQHEFWDDILGRGDGADALAESMDYVSVFACPSGDDSDYYGKRTNGYRSMIKLGDAMEQVVRTIYYEKEQAIEYGQQTAYRNAASTITGTGYGIITNSAVDLLFYNAVSNATLKSQAKKADEQYARESGAAARRAHSIYARQMGEVYYDQFIPAARRCISVWANEITERALAYMIRNGHPVFLEIKKYNQQESKKILEKITRSTSKDDTLALLHQAFELCPFDFDIYKKAAQIGVLDLETMKLFMSYVCSLDDHSTKFEIIHEIEAYCRKNYDNKNIINEQCELLLYVSYGKTKKEVLEKLFVASISNVKNSYKGLKKVLSGEREVVSFIKSRLQCGKECTQFAETSKETIEKEIKNYVDGLLKGINLQFMLDENLITYEDLTTENLTDISAINKAYCELIVGCVMVYNEKMKEELRRFETAKLKYDEELKSKKMALEELENEKASLGVLKFSRKKELESLIFGKKDEISKFEREIPKINWC